MPAPSWMPIIRDRTDALADKDATTALLLAQRKDEISPLVAAFRTIAVEAALENQTHTP